jgi:non-specific serine/threonine protein kinase
MDIKRLLDQILDRVPIPIKKRGLELYLQDYFIEPFLADDGNSFDVTVVSSSGSDLYDVILEYEAEHDEILTSCSCAYFEANLNDCKHIIAAAFQWKKLLSKTSPASLKTIPTKPISPVQLRAVRDDEPIGHEFLYPIGSLEYWKIASYRSLHYARTIHKQALIVDHTAKSILLEIEGEQVCAKFVDLNHLLLNCSCGMLSASKFCAHAVTLINGVVEHYNPFYFRTFNDYTKEIADTYKRYGINPETELARSFKFGINHSGEFIILNRPANLLPLSGFSSWEKEVNAILPVKKIDMAIDGKTLPTDIKAVGLLINLGGKNNMSFWIDGLLETEKKNKTSYKKVILQHNADMLPYSHLSAEVLECIRKITIENMLNQIIARTGYTYLRNYANPFNQIDQHSQVFMLNLLKDTLKELLTKNDTGVQFYAIAPGDSFSNQNCQPVQLFNASEALQFHLMQKDNFWVLSCMLNGPGGATSIAEFIKYPHFLKRDSEIYLLDRRDIEITDLFKGGNIMVHQQDTTAFLDRVVKPLQLKYPVTFDGVVEPELITGSAAEPRIYLSELNESFLMIRPKWKYGEFEVEMDGSSFTLLNVGPELFNVERAKEAEASFIQALRALHPRFKIQKENDYFYLPFKEALEKSWFMIFFEEMHKLGIQVYGVAELKRFKYNANSPSLRTNISSGIDWFDMHIAVHYGDQSISLAELKKAVLAKQEYVLLKDGTFGVLPEEWIKKYSNLFKMGKLNGEVLEVSKFHYTLLDQLHSQMDDEQLQKELRDKKQRLERLGDIKEVSLPESVTASLRDYQLTGFQWMNQLDLIGWGGCLADDMGLGKTLQTLTFLQHRIQQHPQETHLIVCPTSLLYNWETEIGKFTPDLKYHIYYGSDRLFNEQDFKANNLIISSYGMVRSDIAHFCEFKFGYVVLDESQNIKNPTAQITKAVQLLKAKNRLILSGTPIQNNTFDLYAQMNFLNPGMLGNVEFFKTEFATAIDKNNDRNKTELLKKLTAPFILRRTKEQVAKDLPDKTETILWCEMDVVQRRVYDEFRLHYREVLMERIEKDGLGKSAIYILEGLLKLRQICDAAALLKDDRYQADSAKMKELLRELTENTGTHKALIFSQFVEMLQLIRIELDKLGIAYCYLDGSTPAHKRKTAVDDFQSDDQQRVFLISLKAGGVGLNLTAADYVYLIDPWWNPAAEQQAIDRTHRIGQLNKIFAYKMICKDTIEEKILQLQQKKKSLAGDLIGEESTFVKKLSKEDVVYLFS